MFLKNAANKFHKILERRFAEVSAAYRKLVLIYRDLKDTPAAVKACEAILNANPKDREGRLMRPMARTLADDDAVRNVIAYIGTLKP